MRVFTKEHREKMRQAHLGVKLSPEHRRKVIKTLHPIRKGGTYEEAFGPKIAARMKQKMRLAKLGKKRPPRTWALTGENHWNWRGGITPLKRRIRATLAWKKWRTAIFERDNYTCQECHIRGGKLEPHHIIPLVETLRRAFDVGNGITLCRSCHLKTIRKEKLFEKKYSHIVNKS